jgi:hypothetical protein
LDLALATACGVDFNEAGVEFMMHWMFLSFYFIRVCHWRFGLKKKESRSRLESSLEWVYIKQIIELFCLSSLRYIVGSIAYLPWLLINDHKSFFLGWPRLARVNPSDPWPGHYTGSTTRSGFKTMIITWLENTN